MYWRCSNAHLCVSGAGWGGLWGAHDGERGLRGQTLEQLPRCWPITPPKLQNRAGNELEGHSVWAACQPSVCSLPVQAARVPGIYGPICDPSLAGGRGLIGLDEEELEQAEASWMMGKWVRSPHRSRKAFGAVLPRSSGVGSSRFIQEWCFESGQP